ncbi:MAG: exodeoxyribonuclease V subunit gamma, partial [Deltaproteobacteria bacterium]|nr:exodeoxyribonuclease V subunit gamma [Deltaproteobacteria bacterium]
MTDCHRTSNRLEVLLQRLAREISQPLASVITPEIILTQSVGMARWVAMELAACHRISANMVFPFPNAFLNLLLEKLSLEDSPEDPFDPAVLTFRIMRTLPSCLVRPGYEGLRSYFAGDSRQIKLLQLSQKIAHLFDQYLVFRPDIILEWDQGKTTTEGDQTWQADLWREVARGHEHLHRVSIQNDIMAKIDRRKYVADNFPERISIFGISYLPAFHLQVLSAISKITRVNWFLMSPCRQYWGEVLSDRDVSRIREKYAHQPGIDVDLHLDKGNPLLASLGMLGRDFLSMIAGLDCDIQEDYLSPARDNLLGMIQADILDMLDAGETRHADTHDSTPGHAPLPMQADESIEIHVCHSVMREIEVLHDNILEMFQRDSDLQPRDILVMTPDIDTYAPFIQAVFKKSTAEGNAIPFSLADRPAMHENRSVQGFFALLGLSGGRMEADKIIELLDCSTIRHCFRLSEQDVATAERWVEELNIRWGVDGSNREEMGVPPFEENTWKSGIDRLLLGYALPVKARHLFAGIHPFDDMEGDHARVLGNFIDFFTCVHATIRDLKTPKTLQDWSAAMETIISRMFLADASTEKELQVLKRLPGSMADIQAQSDYSDTMELDCIVYHLKNGLQTLSFGSGFLAGSVTFCAMLPMRSIPFKAICLIGMNGSAFPRDDKTLGFDLMAAQPRLGDRSQRKDDKYLFLEALISARKKLYISYVGRDIQDNSTITPSVMVSELMDYMANGYAIPADKIQKQHPLQAFSSRYFSPDPDLFSYSTENHAAAEAAQGAAKKSRQVPCLPEPAEHFKRLEVGTLGTFFVNPVKFFLQKRLGIFLEEGDGLPEESENFRLQGLGGYNVRLESLKSGIEGCDLDALLPVFKARGVLPPGRVGRHDFAEIVTETKGFISRMEAWISGTARQDQAMALHLGDFSISGRLADLYGHGIVRARCVKFNAKDLIRLWIEHLQLCTTESGKDRPQSVYLCRDATVVLEPVDNSHDVLAYLLRLYWEGLSSPLHFFPQSAFAYAQNRLRKQTGGPAALQSAA